MRMNWVLRGYSGWPYLFSTEHDLFHYMYVDNLMRHLWKFWELQADCTIRNRCHDKKMAKTAGKRNQNEEELMT